MIWELEEAQEALKANDVRLAQRYISKALEQVRCVRCHKFADATNSEQYFKGRIHPECVTDG